MTCEWSFCGACALSVVAPNGIASFLREFAWPAVDPDDRLTSARRRILTSLSLIAAVAGVIEGLTWFDETHGLSPSRAGWTLWSAFAFFIPPAILWWTGQLRVASVVLVSYFLFVIGVQMLSPVGLSWAMVLKFFVVPPISIALLGPRNGATLSVVVVACLVWLTHGTIPRPIGVILINVIAATTIGILIFVSEIEKTTKHLDRLRREAQAADRAKSFFLANVSHEIRTPLNGVIGAVQLLEDQVATQDQKELLRTAETSGRALLRIVNDILDFSRIVEHGIRLEKIPFRREDLVTNVFSALAVPAEQKGITLRQTFAEDVPPYLVGDPTRLSQIVMNYVGNAVKFSDGGTVEVRVSREVAPDIPHKEVAAREMIRVEVRDEGIGLTEEAAARVFETFEQAENATARIYGGTGLGLPIARNLAKLHGGETGVRSTPGKGSTFWFTFPLVAGARPTEQIRVAPAPGPARFDHARVMVVEDNRTNQFIIRKFLARLGVDPEIAADGVEAVEVAARRRFELIFMDIQMPRKSGIEATRDIRKGGLNKDTPIVALSANVMPEQRAAYLAAGMNGCIGKPFNLGDITASLDRFVVPGDQEAAPSAVASGAASGRGNDNTSSSASTAIPVKVTKAGR
ncbi:ATP-binding protein [Aquicoccus sp. SU-CL01552]|uniref:ATP-binding protein n=1 Tax=Aquicoccus sp. SU-CL01552 TaxID=3127656 RepID=UPI00333E193C